MNAIARGIIVSICFFASIGSASLAGDLPPARQGQTVYVPVYSDVLFGNADRMGKPDRWPLSATLSIRNTDLENSLTVRSIRYYDTNGKLVREYPAGNELGPLGTMEVFVEHDDHSGGSGANFLVVWNADKPINIPIIETVHTYFFGTRSVAFTSSGQPLHVESR
jgi:hypothetical protein